MSVRLLMAVAVVMAGLITAPASTAAKRAGGGGGVTKHDVELFWAADDQDLIPGDTVLDTFDSTGKPFGAKAVDTLVPRNQSGEDFREGKWRLYLPRGPRKDPGRCVGTFELKRTVVETTETEQTVDYKGGISIKGCSGTKKYKLMKPGVIGTMEGTSTCTATDCKGGLAIYGTVRY